MKHSIAPQRLNPAFDDRSLIANAGMLPAVLLLERLGIGEITDKRLSLGESCRQPQPRRQAPYPDLFFDRRRRLHRGRRRAALRRHRPHPGV